MWNFKRKTLKKKKKENDLSIEQTNDCSNCWRERSIQVFISHDKNMITKI